MPLLQTDVLDEGAHRVTPSVPDVYSTKGDTAPLRDEVRSKPTTVALPLSRHSRLKLPLQGVAVARRALIRVSQGPGPLGE